MHLCGKVKSSEAESFHKLHRLNDKLFCTHILILCCPHGISSSSFNCISSVFFGFLQNQASAFVILKTGSTCSAKFPVAVFACIHAMVSVGQHIYKTL